MNANEKVIHDGRVEDVHTLAIGLNPDLTDPGRSKVTDPHTETKEELFVQLLELVSKTYRAILREQRRSRADWSESANRKTAARVMVASMLDRVDELTYDDEIDGVHNHG